jgi:N,N-dimethylformamidase beta subunit-like, C-terminal
MIVFSGHHEYVTTHEYDVVQRYRDLGGNLMFLSANNFFWKVELHGTVMTRVALWRHLGRPEAALIGVQYRGNDRGTHRGGWLVRRTQAAPWLFAGTTIRNGTRVGDAGIEIDKRAPSSPKSLRVIAEIPNLFGPGFTAQMTYYETPAGAKVFAAGAFTLAGSVWEPQMRQLVTNVWSHLSVEE